MKYQDSVPLSLCVVGFLVAVGLLAILKPTRSPLLGQTLTPTTFNGKPIRVPCFVTDTRLPGVVYPLGYALHCDPDRWITEAP